MNKQQDQSLAIMLLAFSNILVAVMLGIMLHLHNELAQAVNTLVVCQAENPAGGCQLERDGYNYNVYWEEK